MGAARFVIGLIFLALLGAGMYGVFVGLQGDDGKLIGLAFGNSEEQTVEIHVELTTLMVGTDVYPYANVNGNTDWTKWANAHFLIKDPAGTQVQLKRQIKSNLVNEAQTRGYTESFLIGTLNQGTDYTFTYIPVVGEPETYQYSFTAPAEDTGRARVSFEKIR